MLAQNYEGMAGLFGMLIFAFPGLALLRIAHRFKGNVLRGILVLIGAGCTLLAALWFGWGLLLSVTEGDWDWALGFIAAGLLVYIVFRSRTPPVSEPGHCRKCNYDLIGNTSGICPECGGKILSPAVLLAITADDDPA